MANTASESPDRPPEKPAPHKKKKWHIATWLALASAATAIVAAVISANQVNVAAAQNAVAEQEQLLTLTTTIASQLAQGQAAGSQSATNPGLATLLGPLVQVQDDPGASQAVIPALTADGQAAAVIINSLGGEGVAGIEYVEVANALAAAGDLAQALTFYKDAVNAPPGDVVTRANALRNEAGVYYSLGQNTTAHQDMMEAAKLFTGHLVLAQSLIESSIAQAYLADSYYQIQARDCQVALADVEAAADPVEQISPSSPDDAPLVELAGQDLAGVAEIRSAGCAAAPNGIGDYGAWAWSDLDMPSSIRSGLGDTAGKAETAAVQACEAAGGGSGCYAHVWFENAYSSFAYDAKDEKWGYSWTKTSAKADSSALSYCGSAKDCAIVERAQTPDPTSPRGSEVQATRG
jgi:tetratricopeptide (TPR) repeat protein